MKYNQLRVLIPFFDGSEKHWMIINFNGEVDKRRVKREVRKYCQRAFGKQVDNIFLRYDSRYMIPDLSVLGQNVRTFNEILTMEHEAIEQAGSDNKDQSKIIEGTELDLSTVFNRFANRRA